MRIRYALAALAAPAMIAGFAGIAQASPAVHPNNVVGSLYDTEGTAGWYTQLFTQTYQKVTGTYSLANTGRTSSGDIVTNGGVGVQLCNSVGGGNVEVGAEVTQPATEFTPAVWSVGYGYGSLSGDPTGDGDPCTGNSFEVDGNFTALEAIPAGQDMQVQLQVAREYGSHGPEGVWFRAEDATSPIANFNEFVPFSTLSDDGADGPYTEASAGMSENTNMLSAPAVNDLADFSNLTATDGSGATHGFAAWNAVSVSSSADGQAPALITPTLIDPSVYARTWHPGHRYYYGPKGHRHYRWIGGYWTSTGGGPSSFSIMGGSIVGE